MEKNKFIAHDIKWDNDKISTFWNYVYSQGKLNKGFAEIVGERVIQLVKKQMKFTGNVLDHSTGYGFIIKYLINTTNCDFYSSEYSSESVKNINNTFKKNDKYKGCKQINNNILPWDDSFFDIIFATEVIEHIPYNDLEVLLKEFARVLTKYGKLIITVPNNENLEKKKQLCPECGAIFHPVQHVNSFNSENLEKLLLQFGFTKFWMKETYLTDGKFTLKRSIKRLYFKIKKEKPNLIFIAEKL